MGDRPILFSAAMVRALLDGRKTQTRRVLTRQNADVNGASWRGKSCPWEGLRFAEAVARETSPISGARDPHLAVPFCHPADEPTDAADCAVYRVQPMVEVGDRLWVRETFRLGKGYDGVKPANAPAFATVWYEAIGEGSPVLGTPITLAGQKRVAIHMPRWASRLTLTVTDVRVQRLQEISEEDAKAEGAREHHDIPVASWGAYGKPNRWSMEQPPSTDHCLSSPRWAFANYFAKLHGEAVWNSNPWVVAVSFTAERRNIDA